MTNNLQASFTLNVKIANKNLIALARLGGKFTKTTIIKIRVLNTGVELIYNGLTKRIDTNTMGEADISLPLSLLKSYLFPNLYDNKRFTFRSGELIAGGSLFSSSAIVVKPIFSDMEGVIPTNLTHTSILYYWLRKSGAEIENSNLTATIEVAKRTLKTNIMEALIFLKQYNVSYEELEKFVINKLKNT